VNTEPPAEHLGTNDERMRILRMLRAGKITAEDASQLLDALESPRPVAPAGTPDAPSPAAAEATPSGSGSGVPRESFDDLGDMIRETVRDALHGSRDVARAWKHVGRSGFGRHLVDAVLSGVGTEVTAPFEDVRATAATRLRFRNTRGDARFIPSTDGKVHIKARRRVRDTDLHDAERLAERLPIDVYEEDGVLTVEGPGARPFHERIRADFEIALPPQTHLDAAVVRGDVTTEYPAGDVTIATVKGDIVITECARAVVRSTSGSVVIRRCRGDVSADVTRGDLVVRGATGAISAASKRGDISIRAGAVRSVRIQTYRGDVTLSLDELRGDGGAAATGTITALHGDVAVYLNPTARCRIEASTLHGEVDSALTLRDVSTDRRRLSGVLNAPDTQLHISTHHGDIALRPAQPPLGDSDSIG
jgi:hypothetical protein